MNLRRAIASICTGVVLIGCSVTTTPVDLGDAGPLSGADASTTDANAGGDASTKDASVGTPQADAATAIDATPSNDAAPEKDVKGSPECTAFCAKLASECGSTCIDECDVKDGHCGASTKAYLDCETKTGQWYCGSGGYSIVSNCTHDDSVCP